MLNVPIPAKDIHFEHFSSPSMWETNVAISEWLGSQSSNVFILDIIYQALVGRGGTESGPANATVIFFVKEAHKSN